jgi:hypothetical protein
LIASLDGFFNGPDKSPHTRAPGFIHFRFPRHFAGRFFG